MSKKAALFLAAASVFLAVFFLSKTQEIAQYSDKPNIRAEVYGAVYPGKMYTTLINLQKLESVWASSTAYAVTLSPEGNVIDYRQTENTYIDYQKYSDGSYTLGNFSGETSDKTGGYDLFDTTNTLVHTFTVQNNPDTDVHGVTKLSNGNFIIPSYKMNVDSDGNKIEFFVIEEQTPTGEVVFTWDSINHIGLDEATFTEERQHWKQEKINDYFHGNSVAEALDGNLLLSGRHVNEVVKINRKTGEVMWRLGGVQSDFTFLNDPENGFSHQHSVTQLSNGNILLFDNGNLRSTPYTRVVEYRLDEKNKTATLVWSYSDGRFCVAMGSVQRLPNGNTLIGWGIEINKMKDNIPRITEVDSSGKVMMQIYYPGNSGLYNVFKEVNLNT